MTEILEPGHELNGYRIESLLGRGGFGLTYLARDESLDRTVAIKEYLPHDFAERGENGLVQAQNADSQSIYDWGLQAFIQEARTLAKFDHPNIVKVLSFIEANGTAYLVMAHEQGTSLATIYKSGQSLNQSFFEQVFLPILDGLEQVHALGYIHRDIKPDNIMVRHNGSPVLIDFGSARQYDNQSDTVRMTSIVSRGYAPMEQYDSAFGQQGPWTDVYALAASLHEGIHGTLPAHANQESSPHPETTRGESVIRATHGSATVHSNRFSNAFLAVVENGLALQPADRPQSVHSWHEQFTAVMPASHNAPLLNTNAQYAASAISTGRSTNNPETQTALSARRSGDTSHPGRKTNPSTSQSSRVSMPRASRRVFGALACGVLAMALLVGSRPLWPAGWHTSVVGQTIDTVLVNFLGVERSEKMMSNWDRVIACFRRTPKVQAVLAQETLHAGDALRLKVNLPDSGFLHAVNIASDDTVTLLYPSPDLPEQAMQAGWMDLPGDPDRSWPVVEPWGRQMVMVLYSKQPLNLDGFATTAELVAELERLGDTAGAAEGLSSVSLFYETCPNGNDCA